MPSAKPTTSEGGMRQTCTYTISFDIPGYNHPQYVSASEFDAMFRDQIVKMISGTVRTTPEWESRLSLSRKGFGHIA